MTKFVIIIGALIFVYYKLSGKGIKVGECYEAKHFVDSNIDGIKQKINPGQKVKVTKKFDLEGINYVTLRYEDAWWVDVRVLDFLGNFRRIPKSLYHATSPWD